MADKSVSVGKDNRGIINQGDHNTFNLHYPQPNNLSSIELQLADAIVSIFSNDGELIGTGFLMTSEYIITSHDTLSKALDDEHLNVTFALRKEPQTFKAKLIETNATHNIALLQIDSDISFSIDIIKHQPKETTQLITTLVFTQKSIHQIEGRAINNHLQIEDSLNPSLSGSPLWSTTHNGIIGMMIVEGNQASMIPIATIIEAFKPLQEALRSWTWRSSFKSVDRGQISIFAMVETLIAMSIALSLWYYNDTFIHILIGLAIAPFLLLRTAKSLEEGIALFEHIVELLFKDSRYSISNIIIFMSGLGYVVANLNGFIVGLSVSLILIYFKQKSILIKIDSLHDKPKIHLSKADFE
ncbi:MAG: trypsin-like peptidase domain-containing protein [Campylobacterales bacterium]|nr:trypsin-like peptidase domain-containing protein [Campylobacterales bacterium]